MRQLATRLAAFARPRPLGTWQPGHRRNGLRFFAVQSSDDLVAIAARGTSSTPSSSSLVPRTTSTSISSEGRLASLDSRRYTSHPVSHRRLQEFLEAEISFLSRGGYSTITVEQVLMHGDPYDVAHLIQKELPARFATRIRQIETTVPGWQDIPALAEVHNMLRTSFCNLRMVDIDSGSLDAFTDVIVDLRQRHKPVVRLLAEAAKALTNDMSPTQINNWMHQFMNSRMGTEMLTNHYMKLFSTPDTFQVGIVDMRCNPAEVCRAAVENVKAKFESQGVTINFHAPHEIEFSFIPQYLHFVLEELIENSAAASVGIGSANPSSPHIEVNVCANPRHVVFSIRDKAGGIPYELEEKVWEYMFTTKPQNYEDCHQGMTAHFSAPGMGLPMCMLFTEYLGGKLHYMTMPGIGTDVFLYLNRIDAPSPCSIDGAL